MTSLANPSSIFLAVGIFGSIGMLGWAAAAIVPLVLHLWNRRQHQTAPWAAMEFLLAAVQEQAKRMRLEQLLLLLLRMSIPIVLALSLADPVWQMLPSIGSSLGSRVPHHHLFVVDTSYSMGYRVADRTRLEHAQQLVRDIIEQSPQGDGFTIVSLSHPSEAIVSLPAFSADNAMAEIAGLRIRDNVADLDSALDIAKQTIASVKTDFPRLQQHRIYILSDMGMTTWQAANSQRVRKTIGEIESLGDIVTIDVGADSATNAGITSVRRGSPIVTPTTQVTWQVGIEQFAGASDGEVQVEMLVDGKLADKQLVPVETGSSTSAQFRYQFDSSGQHVVEFRIDDDALLVDNHRYEVITVREKVNVLCVEGTSGAAGNVALALAPTRDSNIEVRVIPDHRMSETLLNEYDAVYLCNVGRFTAERTSQMRDYLKRNGGVVMFLGDQASPENYNQLLGGDDDRQSSLLPARLVEVAPYASYRLAPEQYRHPLVSPFRGQERAGLLTTPIWNYFRLKVEIAKGSSTTNPTVALKFANGDPAIVEHSVLGGQFILFAMPASERSVTRQGGQLRPWTAWNAWPSFPPLIQESLAFSLTSQDKPRNVTVGTPITSTLPESSGVQFVSIQHPAAAASNPTERISRRVAVQESIGPPLWIHDQTYSSGVYEVAVADIDRIDQFAVNLSETKESQLERVTIDELPSQFQQNSITANSADESTDINLATTPLFRMMLGLLLVLLLTESYVAWHLGNARS